MPHGLPSLGHLDTTESGGGGIDGGDWNGVNNGHAHGRVGSRRQISGGGGGEIGGLWVMEPRVLRKILGVSVFSNEGSLIFSTDGISSRMQCGISKSSG